MKNHGLYVIKNTVNGKQYVGQSMDIMRRRSKHLTGGSRCPALTGAINKYGRQAFEFKILAVGMTKKDVDVFEKAMIKRLGTVAPGGYNLTSGGDASGRSPSAETRAKLSAWQKGKKYFSPEHRRKISESASARRSTAETCRKISQGLKKSWHLRKIGKEVMLAHD